MKQPTKVLSNETTVVMAALLALHDIECGNIESARNTLQYLVDRLDIENLKKLLDKRLNND